MSRGLSLVAVFFSLIAIAIQAFSILFQLAPLVVLEASPSFNAFSGAQINDLALMFLQVSARAFHIYLVLFGFWCVLVGYLVFRSTFMPRTIGLLEVVAGLSWLTFLWLPLAHYLSPYNQALAALGEMSLTLWLLVKGVNAERWTQVASAAAR